MKRRGSRKRLKVPETNRFGKSRMPDALTVEDLQRDRACHLPLASSIIIIVIFGPSIFHLQCKLFINLDQFDPTSSLA